MSILARGIFSFLQRPLLCKGWSQPLCDTSSSSPPQASPPTCPAVQASLLVPQALTCLLSSSCFSTVNIIHASSISGDCLVWLPRQKCSQFLESLLKCKFHMHTSLGVQDVVFVGLDLALLQAFLLHRCGLLAIRVYWAGQCLLLPFGV